MPRNVRLLQILQHLRRARGAVRAGDLARETGVSLRSIYRDIDRLRAMGALIDGAAGYGYTLLEDPALPPMMFTPEEIEALVLGLRQVCETGDPALESAARNAGAKLQASLPANMQMPFRHAPLYAKSFRQGPEITVDMAALRKAVRAETVLEIRYRDAAGRPSIRRIWPLGIVYMDAAQVLAAWCELRGALRAFRIDRIGEITPLEKSFRPRRAALLREFFEQNKRDGRPSARES